MNDKPGIIRLDFLSELKKTLADPLFLCIAAALLLAVVTAIILLVRKRRKRTRSAINIAVANVHGIGGRDSQQDAFAVSSLSDAELCKSRGVLAVLADGMGGMSFGSEISGIVVASMMEAFQRGDVPESQGDALMRLVRLADEKVADFLGGHANSSGGSTVVAVIVKDKALDYISVGDSRVCLIRDGRMETLCRAHNYGTELDELAQKGVYTAEYAAAHPYRHALTSFIGIKDLNKIDRSFRSIPIRPGDRVLLMSDGVFNTLSDDRIIKCMKPDIYASADALEKAVMNEKAPDQDNYTAVLIDCSPQNY